MYRYLAVYRTTVLHKLTGEFLFQNILYHAVKECVAFLENYELTHGEPK